MSHTPAQTSVFLTVQNVELMGYPPYSPDLASNDFFLLQHIKKKERGELCSSSEDAIGAFKKHILEVAHSEWKVEVV